MAARRFPRCFLSGSLREEDRAVFEWFAGVLDALEFEVSRGDDPEARPPPEKVRGLIQGSDAIVAILTRRDKLEGRNVWRPPEWVQNEIGMAYEAGKPVAAFVEEGVDLEGLAPLVTQYERFDRADLGAATRGAVRYLVSLRNQLGAAPVPSDQAALARGLAWELADRVLWLQDIERTLNEGPWLNPTWAYGRISGRVFMLSDEVRDKVVDAYAGIEEVSDLVRRARAAAGFGFLRRGPSLEDALKKPEVKAVADKLAEVKRSVGDRVATAWVALLLEGWPVEGRNLLRVLQDLASRQGLPSDPKDSGKSPPHAR